LDVRDANGLVEQFVDRSLPLQLAGLFAIHESTLCGLLAAKTKTREHPPALGGTAASALGAAMAAYDEAMHTTAYATFVEMRSQDERTSPAATPEH
jgi:hypothetical protein